MKDLRKKVVLAGLLRSGIVLLIMGVGTYFTYQSGDTKQYHQMLAVTVISSSVAGASAIYDYDVWSVKKKIVVHTICMLLTVYPSLIYSGWYDTTSAWGYLMALLSFIAFGLIFCTIGYLVSKYILKNIPEK
ncbi:DUF3021 family protein [Streptococcus merionis]|uniref:Protein of uncharacterized function (DUF3021) n=1 Tax=Streptococcus merionis TaxID=400065 RepID=A0A239SRW4_9STRE|nr:DUF3021 family protein [Streptococcus merionis]SNU88170.1 Protein of uncharacterised function (DUF3021) [Streptococcus merionis]